MGFISKIQMIAGQKDDWVVLSFSQKSSRLEGMVT